MTAASAAFTIGSTVIYRSALIIVFGIVACFFLSNALFLSHGGRAPAMWIFLPVALFLSVFFSRFIHWYCHAEQYAGLWKALTDYSHGSFVITGIFPGMILAVMLVRRLGYTQNAGRMFDCLAPGTALLIAFIRLSSLFNSTCRSKITVTHTPLQTLPIASAVTTGSGAVEYRFATFFVQFLLMLGVFLMLLIFFRRRRRAVLKEGCRRDGNVALMFVLWYSAVELLLDSTRFDSSFVHFNGFVSIVQMVCALNIIAVLVYYSIISIRVNGRSGFHWGVWVEYFITLAAVGVSEYMVQRHGDKYIICYSIMTVACYFMTDSVYRMYLSLYADEQ